ncbi:hypothetical protein [Streptomyces boninensis]|uniref:hypothetical protein n=1 Tax=Streptomyces boninensis TaxID=2039455 RepID=UPI003B21C45C
MSVHISLLLGLGLFLLSTAAVAWMVRVLIAPQAEQDAFADLVRQLPRGLRG